ncbi:hypothetical protein ABZ345_08995 [Lentzea sp. NPDC005914]|uniref:hypothetical protein n=1 Tax=Lentzea sp. NPDC005914 TaxID=3154572 RepID=UPI0033FE5F77
MVGDNAPTGWPDVLGVRISWEASVGIDMVEALSGLAVRRPIFHSEADFQHLRGSLGWTARGSSCRAGHQPS